jgi:hypothetical protein
LNSASITDFDSADKGLEIVFYLEVYTEAGDNTAVSEHATIVLADVPD